MGLKQETAHERACAVAWDYEHHHALHTHTHVSRDGRLPQRVFTRTILSPRPQWILWVDSKFHTKTDVEELHFKDKELNKSATKLAKLLN